MVSKVTSNRPLQKEDDRDSRDTVVNLGSLSNVFSAPKAPDVTPDVPDAGNTCHPEPATEPAPEPVTPVAHLHAPAPQNLLLHRNYFSHGHFHKN
jgi:hypothetical protein